MPFHKAEVVLDPNGSTKTAIATPAATFVRHLVQDLRFSLPVFSEHQS